MKGGKLYVDKQDAETFSRFNLLKKLKNMFHRAHNFRCIFTVFYYKIWKEMRHEVHNSGSLVIDILFENTIESEEKKKKIMLDGLKCILRFNYNFITLNEMT